MPTWLAKYWKAIPAAAGAISQVIALQVLTGSQLHYAQVALAVLTFLGVVLVPKNADPAPLPAQPVPAPPGV